MSFEVIMLQWRPLAYLWALPTSLLGLLFVPESLISGEVRWIDGVLEVHGRLVRFFLTHCTLLRGGASAMACSATCALGPTRSWRRSPAPRSASITWASST